MLRAGARGLLWVLLLGGCVEPPEATRDGGETCRSEADCNGGVTCGQVRLCVLGVCAEDRVFRACPNGSYPDGGAVGQCLTYLNCNTASCGELVPCNERGLCDRGAPPLVVPCDAGR